MSGKVKTSVAVVLLFAAAAVLFWIVQEQSHEVCPLCTRMIHDEARAVIEVEGSRQRVCCVRCALRALSHAERGRLVRVSDFMSGQAMRPADAWYVEDTPVVMCDRHLPPADPAKRGYVRVFDRCEPSVFAFRRELDARTFAKRNGGHVARLPEIFARNGVRQ